MTILNRQGIALLLLKGQHEIVAEALKNLQQRLSALCGAGMDDQIPLRCAPDLHAVTAEAELGGNAHGLTVPTHEHTTGEDIHHTLAVPTS